MCALRNTSKELRHLIRETKTIWHNKIAASYVLYKAPEIYLCRPSEHLSYVLTV